MGQSLEASKNCALVTGEVCGTLTIVGSDRVSILKSTSANNVCNERLAVSVKRTAGQMTTVRFPSEMLKIYCYNIVIILLVLYYYNNRSK